MIFRGLIVLLFVATCHSFPEEGQSRDRRVIGGDEIEKGKHPFLVSLWFFGENNYTAPGKPHFCGGSLIHKQWVLTAAHCFDDNNFPESNNVSLWKVALGMHAQGQAEEEAQFHDIRQIFPSPQYNLTELIGDVALVKLDKPATLDKRVGLVEINRDPGCPTSRDNVIVAGWGNLNATFGKGLSSDVPREAILNVTTLEYCQNQYHTPQVFSDYGMTFSIDDRSVCAGISEGGVDSCAGDSGGPLVTVCDGHQVQAGIVNHGYGCAKPNYPGVYARVSAYKEWIDSTIKNNP